MNGAKKGYDPDESTGGNPLTRLSRTSYVTSQEPVLQIYAYFLLFSMKAPRGMSMSSDFPHYSFRMPNIGFQNLPLNIYIVVFGTAIFVFILSLLFCCYLIRVSPGRNKLNRNNVQQDSAMQQFPTKFTPRHPAISYLAGQMIPLTLLREVKVTYNGGYGTRRTKSYMHTNKSFRRKKSKS
ncbi:RING finger protein 24 isoform X3 [Etheostoma cragini]|uniref:RING finger protein 24 isoform X3 n=1 Tax=Etheostoma cragini TaxID=417921 RepID=UPI00155F3D66|nr:RING finger protein 24 isoform X3 [Etheostoma cragini]